MFAKWLSKNGINDFRPQFAILLGLLGILILSPFIIVHLVSENYILATGIFLLVVSFIYTSRTINRDNRRFKIISWVIVPVMLPVLLVSLYSLGIKASFWLYPSVIVLYLVLPRLYALTTNVILVILTSFIAYNTLDFELTLRLIASLTVVNVFIAAFIFVLEEQQDYLKKIAITDQLTGLRNRTSLMHKLDDLVCQANRCRTPLSFISLDLDLFKKINDTHGHAIGDEVLKTLARTMLSRIRKTDLAFRMGGEEFLIVLFDTDLEGAFNLAEVLRHTIEAEPAIKTTASFGISGYRYDEKVAIALKRADDNLYKAKRTGRNKVVR
ncbi:MAG: Response regulator PleD [Marinobacterium sp. xm-d-530]|nr:MAG: Response regulator PleD [Marinobacterium sp. xm-d-530]